MTTYTINTLKGSYTTADLRDLCSWQANMQGAMATITVEDGETGVDVDGVFFDGGDLDQTECAVRAAIGGLGLV